MPFGSSLNASKTEISTRSSTTRLPLRVKLTALMLFVSPPFSTRKLSRNEFHNSEGVCRAMAEDGSLYVDTSNSRNKTVVVKLRDSLRQRDPPANAPAALESRLGGNGLSGSTATNSDMYEGHGKKRMDSAINRLERLVVRLLSFPCTCALQHQVHSFNGFSAERSRRRRR
jgi:hypothetical protein